MRGPRVHHVGLRFFRGLQFPFHFGQYELPKMIVRRFVLSKTECIFVIRVDDPALRLPIPGHKLASNEVWAHQFARPLILSDELDYSKWNLLLNPFDSPYNINDIVWRETIRQNRIIMSIVSVVLLLLGLLNLQQREKFLR